MPDAAAALDNLLSRRTDFWKSFIRAVEAEPVEATSISGKSGRLIQL
jgi:hypothetical protein